RISTYFFDAVHRLGDPAACRINRMLAILLGRENVIYTTKRRPGKVAAGNPAQRLQKKNLYLLLRCGSSSWRSSCMPNQPNVGYFVGTRKRDLHDQTSSRKGSSRQPSPKTPEKESLLTSSMRLIVLEIQLHAESTECWLFCCDAKT